ncbi:hypothetical protein HK102_010717, partial [Quaeritorhiza haematococci]
LEAASIRGRPGLARGGAARLPVRRADDPRAVRLPRVRDLRPARPAGDGPGGLRAARPAAGLLPVRLPPGDPGLRLPAPVAGGRADHAPGGADAGRALFGRGLRRRPVVRRARGRSVAALGGGPAGAGRGLPAVLAGRRAGAPGGPARRAVLPDELPGPEARRLGGRGPGALRGPPPRPAHHRAGDLDPPGELRALQGAVRRARLRGARLPREALADHQQGLPLRHPGARGLRGSAPAGAARPPAGQSQRAEELEGPPGSLPRRGRGGVEAEARARLRLRRGDPLGVLGGDRPRAAGEASRAGEVPRPRPPDHRRLGRHGRHGLLRVRHAREGPARRPARSPARRPHPAQEPRQGRVVHRPAGPLADAPPAAPRLGGRRPRARPGARLGRHPEDHLLPTPESRVPGRVADPGRPAGRPGQRQRRDLPQLVLDLGPGAVQARPGRDAGPHPGGRGAHERDLPVRLAGRQPPHEPAAAGRRRRLLRQLRRPPGQRLAAPEPRLDPPQHVG